MKSRILLLFSLFFLGWMGLILRATQIQVVPHQQLADLQKRQFEKRVTIKARRGVITDRNGVELAATVPSYSLYVDPELVAHPHALSQRLHRALGISLSTLRRKLTKSGRFVWLQRQLTQKMRDHISSWEEPALGFIEEPKRIYPHESLFSQGLGFVGRDERGLEGLELKFNKELTGEKRSLSLLRDARGRPLLIEADAFLNRPDGSQLTLTIDSELQYKLESELEQAIREFDAESAVGVILDAQTSEVLAMANSPGYNLNHPLKYPAQLRRNRNVTDAFEPGSTMKTFVIAGALRDGVVSPKTKINCEGGKFRIADRVINEADANHRFEWLTVSEVLAHSSNIGSTKIAMQLGDRRLRETLKDFGFGQKSNVELPGETTGILRELPWRPHLLSNISFGHGMTASALQIANAYAAIANGGVLKAPSIVKSIVTGDGVISAEREKTLRRVLSEEDASNMRFMLRTAASRQASGFDAQVAGFPVAGKTGTAQLVNPNGRGYLPGAYISSFAGFLPANQAKFVIYIAVNRPQGKYYGSQVAAPIFARVGQYAVRKYGLAPIVVSESDLLKEKGLEEKDQLPVRKTRIDTVTSGRLQTMPDFTGLSLREVVHRLKGQDHLRFQFKGAGRVVETYPPAGALVSPGERVSIRLKETTWAKEM